MQNENKLKIITAAITGFLAVAIGAFGAHGLSSTLSENMMDTYETGVLYHLVHSVVLLGLAVSTYNFNKSFWFIFTGIILFSFSLYFYSITGIRSLAIITPFGGVGFLIGWLLIIYEIIKNPAGR